MVLGLRSKSRKGTSVKVEYVIHIEEIKLWPPSQSLKLPQSVWLQLENGEWNVGSTKVSVLSIGSGSQCKIYFNDFFRLLVTLSRRSSSKGVELETFHKNYLFVSMYEYHGDKFVKSHPLGMFSIDLAEYGVIKDPVSINVPMNCKKSNWNAALPTLYMKILPYESDSVSSPSRDSLSKGISWDGERRESVSDLMNEDVADDIGIRHFIDDDDEASSQCSRTSMNKSPPYSKENVGSQSVKSDGPWAVKKSEESDVGFEEYLARSNEKSDLQKVLVKSDNDSAMMVNDFNISVDHTAQTKKSSFQMTPGKPSGTVSSETITADIKHDIDKISTVMTSDNSNTVDEIKEFDNLKHADQSAGTLEKMHGTGDAEHDVSKEASVTTSVDEKKGFHNLEHSSQYAKTFEQPSSTVSSEMINADIKQDLDRISTSMTFDNCNTVDEIKEFDNLKHADQSAGTLEKMHGTGDAEHDISKETSVTTSVDEKKGFHNLEHSSKYAKTFEQPSSTVSSEMINADIKQDLDRISTSMTFDNCNTVDEIKELDNLKRSDQSAETFEQLHGTGGAEHNVSKEASVTTSVDERKGFHNLEHSSTRSKTFEQMHRTVDSEYYASKETSGTASDCNTQDLLCKVEKLKTELRETAAIEVALYTVVAEHGSSVHKVHTPARRLSRMYMHAYRSDFPKKRVSAARSILSGLSLVAKSCGNDVPRLTYWLSNSVVFRTIIFEGFGHSDGKNQSGMHINNNGIGKRFSRRNSTLKRIGSTMKEESLVDLQDPKIFAVAIEKIEFWIFSQIIKSIWWQTLTLYMQYPTEERKIQQTKSVRKMLSLTRDLNRNNSVNLWKKALQDAFGRLCPARAGGHECGCLPVLAKLVMEQCVARLDVAMFNAILRESDNEIPTDPISDPISGSKVLPVSCGSLSFGAGAELKNAVGTWSTWLIDLLKIDDSESHEVDDQDCFEKPNLKAFRLLNALSDLLMLPKNILLNASIRKEVCPTFPAPLIKRILEKFVPDEFCPDPVPEAILAALDSEGASDQQHTGAEPPICNYPCNAAPVNYSPPSTSSVSGIIGDVQGHIKLKNTSMVLRQSYISDDELDELDSPLPSIIGTTSPWLTADKGENLEEHISTVGSEKFMRYHLLREVWIDGH